MPCRSRTTNRSAACGATCRTQKAALSSDGSLGRAAPKYLHAWANMSGNVSPCPHTIVAARSANSPASPALATASLGSAPTPEPQVVAGSGVTGTPPYPALTWGAGGGAEASEAVASARLAGLLADRAATIVCGHGETLPDMLAQACRYFGAALPSEPSLDKAAFWVLHVAPHAAERFVVLERHGIG